MSSSCVTLPKKLVPIWNKLEPVQVIFIGCVTDRIFLITYIFYTIFLFMRNFIKKNIYKNCFFSPNFIKKNYTKLKKNVIENS